MGKISNLLQISMIIKVLSVLAILGLWGSPAVAGPVIRKLELSLIAKPDCAQMLASARLSIDGISPGTYSAIFTEPRRIMKFVDQTTGKSIPFKFVPFPGATESTGYKVIEFTIESLNPSPVLFLEYEYDKETLVGFAPNPSTHDNLYLGQLTEDSIYSSHLYYYPEAFGGPQSARLEITVPKKWTAVSSGPLTAKTSQGGMSTFVYEPQFSSGRLPYSLAIYPYEETTFIHQGRFPITIFHSPSDGRYAQQKMDALRRKILPFLEHLMGPFPFGTLKIIEVFPWEGNTGLAARGIVMLSQKMWFADDIDESLSTLPASVLVDEIAHQWNFYKLQLPNYLAEGVSQYTDALFTEHMQGSAEFTKELEGHRTTYQRMATLLNQLKSVRDSGGDINEASNELAMPVEALQPYWPFAEWGEVAISDPRVFPALYFLKGALALHALRLELGDRIFFRAFRAFFEKSASTYELTLPDFKRAFERESGRSLKTFFDLWYNTPGMPILRGPI